MDKINKKYILVVCVVCSVTCFAGLSVDTGVVLEPTHFSSSDPSLQSRVLSQNDVPLMHWLDVHLDWSSL